MVSGHQFMQNNALKPIKIALSNFYLEFVKNPKIFLNPNASRQPSPNIFSSLLRYVVPFNILWVGANYAYSQALGHISASAASSIMSSNTAIVWVLGLILLKGSFSIIKVLQNFIT